MGTDTDVDIGTDTETDIRMYRCGFFDKTIHRETALPRKVRFAYLATMSGSRATKTTKSCTRCPLIEARTRLWMAR